MENGAGGKLLKINGGKLLVGLPTLDFSAVCIAVISVGVEVLCLRRKRLFWVFYVSFA